MVDTTLSFTQVFYTYKDVKEANPDWPDKMIEDYLSLKRDLTSSTEQADTAEDYNFGELNSLGAAASLVDVPAVEVSGLQELEPPEVSNALLLSLLATKGLTMRSMTGTTLTTAGGDHEVIVCLNSAAGTVTLNTNPKDGECVTVCRRDAGVTISGAINGASSVVIGLKYDTVQLVFSLDAAEWMII